MGKKTKDLLDGRLVFYADLNEVFEVEVDKDKYEAFRCVEGGSCKGCDFQFLTMDVCLCFACTKAERTDLTVVHFKWEGNNA